MIRVCALAEGNCALFVEVRVGLTHAQARLLQGVGADCALIVVGALLRLTG